MYTLTDLRAMSNLELRKVIAEMKGYVCKHGYMDEAGINPKDYWITPEGRLTSMLPNWPESISDAYALEEDVPKDRRFVYAEYLRQVIVNNYYAVPAEPFKIIHSTPRQRCEAFVLTMQKDKE